MSRSSGRRRAAAGEPARFWNWLDAVGVMWLALVASAYSLVAFYPPIATRNEVPGVEAAERHYWMLLALVLLAAVARQRRRCRSGEGAAHGGSGDSR